MELVSHFIHSAISNREQRPWKAKFNEMWQYFVSASISLNQMKPGTKGAMSRRWFQISFSLKSCPGWEVWGLLLESVGRREDCCNLSLISASVATRPWWGGKIGTGIPRAEIWQGDGCVRICTASINATATWEYLGKQEQRVSTEKNTKSRVKRREYVLHVRCHLPLSYLGSSFSNTSQHNCLVPTLRNPWYPTLINLHTQREWSEQDVFYDVQE